MLWKGLGWPKLKLCQIIMLSYSRSAVWNVKLSYSFSVCFALFVELKATFWKLIWFHHQHTWSGSQKGAVYNFQNDNIFNDTLTKRLIIELTSVFTIYPKTDILAHFDFGDFQISELLSYTHVAISRFPFYCILISAYWAPLTRIAKAQVLLKCKWSDALRSI